MEITVRCEECGETLEQDGIETVFGEAVAIIVHTCGCPRS